MAGEQVAEGGSGWSATVRIVVAVIIASALAVRGLRKKSLDKSGAVAGWIVGFITFSCGSFWGVLLIAFFLAGSRVTRVGAREKQRLEASHKEGGQRTWVQVLCNSAPAVALALFHAARHGGGAVWPVQHDGITHVVVAYTAFYACCAGDTFASELGVLSTEQPRMLLSCRHVRRGTNGGITAAGTAASALGGCVVALVGFVWAVIESGGEEWPWWLVVVGISGGLFGSAVDSVFGATLQYSGLDPERKVVVEVPAPGIQRISGRQILDNNTVNLAAGMVTAVVAWFSSAVFHS